MNAKHKLTSTNCEQSTLDLAQGALRPQRGLEIGVVFNDFLWNDSPTLMTGKKVFSIPVTPSQSAGIFQPETVPVSVDKFYFFSVLIIFCTVIGKRRGIHIVDAIVVPPVLELGGAFHFNILLFPLKHKTLSPDAAYNGCGVSWEYPYLSGRS